MSGSILLPIISIFRGKGVKDAIADLTTFGGVIGTTKKLLGGFGAYKIATGAFDFIKDSTLKARDYERELRALKTIFGTSAPEMEKFAKNSADIGLSTAESAKASVFLGSVLKQSGFTMGKVTDETKKLVGLASDLATVYGYDVSEALSGMTALFRGEYDPIEKFGVAMKQAEVNALLLERGQKNLTGGMLRQAQAQARLDLLYQRSADSQGAFAKGQGTLFVEQRNLSVAFENFQAQIAQALIPVLAKMMALIGDFVTRNGPLLTKVFESFAQVINDVFNELNADQKVLDGLVQTFVILTEVLSLFARIVVKHSAAIVALGIGYVTALGVMKAWKTIMPIITIASWNFKAAIDVIILSLNTMAVRTAVATAGISLLVAGAVIGTQSLIDQKREIDKVTKALKEYGGSKYDIGKLTTEEIAGGKAVNDILSDELKGLELVNAAYRDRARLRGLARAAVAEQVAADKKAAADAAKAAAEAFAKQAAAYKAAFKDMLSTFTSGNLVTRQLGQLESSVKTTFDGIFSKITEGLNNKLINGKAVTNLRNYAKDVKRELMEIASERDKLGQKLDLGKALIADTKKAVVGFASLSNLMAATGQSVTKSVSFMVGKFKVTTTETVAGVANAATIIDKFKNIVSKTKEFKTDLEKLRKLGLTGDLYTQILGLGLDEGGAMAKSILAGGATAVKTLEDLQTELTTLGGQMGESAAQVMYGAGLNLGQGLVTGILAADASLKEAADKLADTFKTAFYGGINPNGYTASFTAPKVDINYAEDAVKEAFKRAKVIDTSGTSSLDNMPGYGGYTFGVGGVPTQITINVAAGIVTDPVKTGQTIVEYVNKYAKTQASDVFYRGGNYTG